MLQFAIRGIFLIYIIILYILGRIISILIDPINYYKIDFSVLLPIFSMCFYDYWIYKFDRYEVKIKIIDKKIKESEIIVRFKINYSGGRTYSVLLDRYGAKGINIKDFFDKILLISSIDKVRKEAKFGENLANLSSDNPWVDVIVSLKYMRDPEKFKIPVLNYFIYFINFNFKINDAEKSKRVWFIEKRP